MTEVKSLGLPGRRLVKMNSNLVWLHLVRRYRASVTPLSFELTVLVVMFKMQLYPTATRQHDFVINFLTARLTEADSLHCEGVPDDPEVGHQHPPSVP